MTQPLAEQLRPHTLEDYIGQEHLMGEGAVLRKAILSDHLPSMIFWGPPGVGKTTLALLIAQHLNRPFFTLSAVHAGVKEVREVLQKVEDIAHHSATPTLFEEEEDQRPSSSQPPILFIDEIHRFNKSQQDSLLMAVEKGLVCFIGATTENPSFEVITPLLSRCQVYVLKSLTEADLDILLQRALEKLEQEYEIKIHIDADGISALKEISGGDGRKFINAIEIVFLSVYEEISRENRSQIHINRPIIVKTIQQNLRTYDKKGEMHYDIISAFIKSIRGSDPNAAVYYLARMLTGGEDVKFIARRLLILASEDIGNANPNALLLAQACFETVHKIGYPECRIPLSQTAIYLACSPKSNASYLAIDQALDFVKKTGDLPVPLHLRNAPTALMKDLDYGKDYLYAHNFENNFVNQEFLPQEIANQVFFQPGNNPREEEMRKRLQSLWGKKYNY